MTTRQTLAATDGTPISALAFGCMQFGGGADEAASQATFEACRDAGITHFDTAHGYTEGRSEELLGRFAAAERERLYIATKVAGSGGAGADNIRRQFDLSRKRLNMDQVDLLYIHIFDPDTPLEETFAALAALQSEGKTRHIGVSNFAAWQVMKAQAVAAGLGTRIDALQPMYSLVKRQAEVELLPMAEDQGIAVFPYSPLGGGLLTGKYAADPQAGRLAWDARYKSRYAAPWMGEAAVALGGIADELGVHPATLAVAWAAGHSGVTAPIISGRSVEQLAPSLAALSFEMGAELRARLAALVPAPPPATDRSEAP
jgi:aryl-alcohol dehydrogenase-like predicted oxidoreductase